MSVAAEQAVAVKATLSVKEQGVRKRVLFDAGPWLRQASVPQISALAEAGYPSREADRVAAWTSEQGRGVDRVALSTAIEHLEAVGLSITYAVGFDPHQFAAFLLAERPDALLYEIAERIRGEEEIQSPWSPAPGRQAALEDLTVDTVSRYLGSMFFQLPDETVEPIAETVYGLLYRIGFALGPGLPVAMLHGTPAASLEQSAASAERAGLYRRAGVPVSEARDLEADPGLRPTDDQLRALGALAGQPR